MTTFFFEQCFFACDRVGARDAYASKTKSATVCHLEKPSARTKKTSPVTCSSYAKVALGSSLPVNWNEIFSNSSNMYQRLDVQYIHNTPITKVTSLHTLFSISKDGYFFK